MSEDVIAVNNQRIGGPLHQEYPCRREVVFAVVCKHPTPEYRIQRQCLGLFGRFAAR
jgi:hypothetical protein